MPYYEEPWERNLALDLQILGEGIYTPREAARLVGSDPASVVRWTRGSGPSEPLWRSYYSELEDSREISFLDLMEVRVVFALRNNGVSLQAIRYAIRYAKSELRLDRPLSSQTFKTDGQSILMEAVNSDDTLISLHKKNAGQRVFKKIVEQSLRDLEYEGARPVRWRPKKFTGVVIDPKRSFGEPLLDEYGISTATLIREYRRFSDIKYLSEIYEIPKIAINEAISFEEKLDGQSTF